MATEYKNIVVALAARLGNFVPGMKQAADVTDQTLAKMKASGGGLNAERFAGMAVAITQAAGALGAMQAAAVAVGGVTAYLKGDWDGVLDSVKRLPFGLGGFAGLIEAITRQVSGLDDELDRINEGLSAQKAFQATGDKLRSVITGANRRREDLAATDQYDKARLAAVRQYEADTAVINAAINEGAPGTLILKARAAAKRAMEAAVDATNEAMANADMTAGLDDMIAQWGEWDAAAESAAEKVKAGLDAAAASMQRFADRERDSLKTNADRYAEYRAEVVKAAEAGFLKAAEAEELLARKRAELAKPGESAGPGVEYAGSVAVLGARMNLAALAAGSAAQDAQKATATNTAKSVEALASIDRRLAVAADSGGWSP
jgi:hypothetical protein